MSYTGYNRERGCDPSPAVPSTTFEQCDHGIAFRSVAGDALYRSAERIFFTVMAKKSYSDLLKDPRWQRRRLEILQRSDFSCEECRRGDKTLHVHHKLYRKGAMPWEYADHELAALCEDCHASEHLIREELAQMMALMPLGDLERLLGYAQGMMLFGGDIDAVQIRNFEHAIGLSDVVSAISGPEVYEFIDRSDKGTLSGRDISQVYTARRDARSKQ